MMENVVYDTVIHCHTPMKTFSHARPTPFKESGSLERDLPRAGVFVF